MSRIHPIHLLFVLGLIAPSMAHADTACPAAVTDAAKKAFPDGTITKCIAEKSHFEVKLTKKDSSKVELDISAKGEIEMIEEVIAISAIPAPVTKAFAAKYGKIELLRAEKQTKADKSVTFEIAFKTAKGMKEATFKADGTFVEEE